jgi:SNF2 family DNA or RNA helicase
MDFLERRKCAGVFADPGLGKTAIALHLIERLYWSRPRLRVLILAPLRVIYSVWPEELKKWGLEYITYAILHGPHKQKALAKKADIDLLNIENIFWHFDNLPDDYDTLIIDESSRFKNPSSKRFKTLKKHLDAFKYRYILTGTPSPNGLMDLWSQVYTVDKGRSLGKNITAYRNRFFYPVQFRNFMEWNIKGGAEQTVYRLTAPLVRRIDAEEHLELPKLLTNNVKISLGDRRYVDYKRLEKDLFLKLEGEEHALLAGSAAAAYNLCRQYANGRMYRPPEALKLVAARQQREVLSIHQHKLKALVDLIRELQGKPVLVAYHFKHDLDQILEYFKGAPTIGGGTSASDSAAIVKDWNRKRVPILLGHPQSMSHGLNLQYGGNDIIWFSLTDNLENYIQFNRRIHRQGATQQTRVHHIVADKTVDLAILKRLEMKDQNQRALLDALARYRKEKS